MARGWLRLLNFTNCNLGSWIFAKRMAKADDLVNSTFSPWSEFAQELLNFTIRVWLMLVCISKKWLEKVPSTYNICAKSNNYRGLLDTICFL